MSRSRQKPGLRGEIRLAGDMKGIFRKAPVIGFKEEPYKAALQTRLLRDGPPKKDRRI